jgi:hypothetical protein
MGIQCLNYTCARWDNTDWYEEKAMLQHKCGVVLDQIQRFFSNLASPAEPQRATAE